MLHFCDRKRLNYPAIASKWPSACSATPDSTLWWSSSTLCPQNRPSTIKGAEVPRIVATLRRIRPSSPRIRCHSWLRISYDRYLRNRWSRYQDGCATWGSKNGHHTLLEYESVFRYEILGLWFRFTTFCNLERNLSKSTNFVYHRYYNLTNFQKSSSVPAEMSFRLQKRTAYIGTKKKKNKKIAILSPTYLIIYLSKFSFIFVRFFNSFYFFLASYLFFRIFTEIFTNYDSYIISYRQIGRGAEAIFWKILILSLAVMVPFLLQIWTTSSWYLVRRKFSGDNKWMIMTAYFVCEYATAALIFSKFSVSLCN